MPQLNRPDGAQLHWEQRGDGPAVVLVHNPMTSTPSTFEALLSDLTADHCVVTWDTRGVGRSSPERPYDLETDADDLAALIEAVGKPAATMSIGFGPAPLVVATRRPDLVTAVLMIGGIGFSAGDDAQSLLDSDSVTAAFRQMTKTDPRAFQRAAITLGNPQLTEVQVRARLEAQLAYCPIAAWAERVDSYLAFDTGRACAALGDCVWAVHWENPMSPGRPLARTRTLLPDAHIVEIEDGPISRPDLTAAVVREATGARARRHA